MKQRFAYLLFTAAMIGAPVMFAQEQPKGGEGSPEGGNQFDGKSDEEVQAEFKRLATEISRDMGKLESEIARASLPPRTAEELKAELDAMLEQLSKQQKVRLNDGLQDWLAADAERLAGILGVSVERAGELIKDQAELLKALSSRTNELQESLSNSGGIQKILEAQLRAEEKIAALIKAQEEQAEALDGKMTEILDTAYELRDRAPP
jgi:DNA repair exonuclease SbcCD ATPase subunit